MTWSKLDAVDVSEAHNPDVIDAISTVCSVRARLNLAYLDPAAVTVDADPGYRAVYFAIPHSDDGSVVKLRHGDGYTYLLSAMGDYHGGVADEELGAFLTAALTGRLVHTVRLRGGVQVEDGWAWQLAGRRVASARPRPLLVRPLASRLAAFFRRVQSPGARLQSQPFGG